MDFYGAQIASSARIVKKWSTKSLRVALVLQQGGEHCIGSTQNVGPF